MRTFKHFNQSTEAVCPICKTNEDKEPVLIGIDGTEKDGNMEAIQVHLDCLELRFNKDMGVFYQKINDYQPIHIR